VEKEGRSGGGRKKCLKEKKGRGGREKEGEGGGGGGGGGRKTLLEKQKHRLEDDSKMYLEKQIDRVGSELDRQRIQWWVL